MFFFEGELEKTITVTVNGDADVEPNETFLVDLNFVQGATIQRGQATGTILNDEGATLPLQLILDEAGPDPIQAAALDSMLLLRSLCPRQQLQPAKHQGLI